MIVELPPPRVDQMEVAFVPAALVVQIDEAFESQTYKGVLLYSPNPAVAPLTSMIMVCALADPATNKHATRTGKTELCDFKRQLRNGEEEDNIGVLNRFAFPDMNRNRSIMHTGACIICLRKLGRHAGPTLRR